MNAQLKPGPAGTIQRDIPAEQYHQRRLDEASASGLKQLLRSPAHFKHWVANPDDDKASPALTFGKALHCATLEPDVFLRTYAVVPSGSPKYPTAAQWGAKKSSPESESAKAWWNEWNANNAGRTRLSLDDYDRARRMADSLDRRRGQPARSSRWPAPTSAHRHQRPRWRPTSRRRPCRRPASPARPRATPSRRSRRLRWTTRSGQSMPVRQSGAGSFSFAPCGG